MINNQFNHFHGVRVRFRRWILPPVPDSAADVLQRSQFFGKLAQGCCRSICGDLAAGCHCNFDNFCVHHGTVTGIRTDGRLPGVFRAAEDYRGSKNDEKQSRCQAPQDLHLCRLATKLRVADGHAPTVAAAAASLIIGRSNPRSSS